MQTLNLTTDLLKAVREGSLYRLPLKRQAFFKGLQVRYGGGKGAPSTASFNHVDTQFISENSASHERLEEMKNDPMRDNEKFQRQFMFIPTYQSFAHFLRYMRNSAHGQKLSERFKATDAKKGEFKLLIMFYVTWLMIPAWAKSESEFRRFWGAELANLCPFDSSNRKPL